MIISSCGIGCWIQCPKYSPSFMLMYESIVKLVQVSNAKGGIEGSALRQRGTCERGSLKNDTDKFFREKHFPS